MPSADTASCAAAHVQKRNTRSPRPASRQSCGGSTPRRWMLLPRGLIGASRGHGPAWLPISAAGTQIGSSWPSGARTSSAGWRLGAHHPVHLTSASTSWKVTQTRPIPLCKQVTAVTLTALNAYAAALGKLELRLVNPFPQLIPFYCSPNFGFSLVVPRREASYCRRSI